MKTITILLLIITGFWACNTSTKQEPSAVGEPEAQQEQHKAVVAQSGLQLNNGAKWAADAPTNANVKNLKAILATFDEGIDRTLAAHLSVAEQLQTGINKMIKECKMKGADHDALHQWLEPLLGQVKQLKAATTETDAAGLLQTIRTQVSYYDQFFE